MLKQKFCLVGFLLLLIHHPSFSQTHILSLQSAFEEALSAYPSITEQQAEVKASTHDLIDAKQQFLPQINVQMQNSYGTFAGSNGAFFPLPGAFNVNGSQQSASSAMQTTNAFGSVLLDWKIFEFGKRRKTIAAAHVNIKKAESGLDASKLKIQTEVSKLYLQVLYQQANLQWAEAQAERIKQIAEISKALAISGLKPGADTLLTTASYLQALGESNDRTGQYAASEIQLKAYVPTLSNGQQYPFKNFLQALPNLQLQDSLNKTHPYLEILARQIDHDHLRSEIAGKSIWPSLSVLGGLSSRSSGIYPDSRVDGNWSKGFDNPANNYLVGVGLTWNISKAYASINKQKRIRQEEIASQSRLDTKSLQLHTDLLSASNRIKEQSKQVIKTTEAVVYARKAYDLYLSRYQHGLINLTELLQIQQLLQQAEKVNIGAYQQFWDQMVLQAELSSNFSALSNHFK